MVAGTLQYSFYCDDWNKTSMATIQNNSKNNSYKLISIQIKYVKSDECAFCHYDTETITHLFGDCIYINPL